MGGLNYYKNLISCIREYQSENIEPVIFTALDAPEYVLESFPGVEIVKTRVLQRKSLAWIIRKSLLKLIPGQRDFILNFILKKNKIDILSHYGPLAIKGGVPCIGWIPDFQHKYLPDFFLKKELPLRDQMFERMGGSCDLVVVSSESAKNDFERFLPRHSKKARVLRFVPDVTVDGAVDFSAIKSKYNLPDSYFYLPNQFWIHKNHVVVIRALAKLKGQGKELFVVCTGNTKDYKRPDHFPALQKLILDLGVSDNFVILGLIPYAELSQLMLNSMAVINPSLFEGWSTTVEEAKLLKKTVILSDIPVHREQDPINGVYFDGESHGDLAEKMAQLDMTVEGSDPKSIADELNKARYLYSAAYQKICKECFDMAAKN